VLINFFDFPTFESENLCYEEANDLATLRVQPVDEIENAMMVGEGLTLVRESYVRRNSEYKTPTFSFRLNLDEMKDLREEYLVNVLFK
jgi:hypothetical protein